MRIKPLYKDENNILVGLENDFHELCTIDGLVIEVDIEKNRILNQPWSGQKKLRNGVYSPIRSEQKAEIRRKIERKLRKRGMRQIIDMLSNPTEDQIKSLIWIPDRLSK